MASACIIVFFLSQATQFTKVSQETLRQSERAPHCVGDGSIVFSLLLCVLLCEEHALSYVSQL